MSNHNHHHYVLWRRTRLAKLAQIFGEEYFRGKSVLECGAGRGEIGRFMREVWGANVTFTEGREELVDIIGMYNPDSKVWHINHEKPWHVGRFDFVIHWGLLYHLNAWQNDLTYAANSLNENGVLALESEVLDFEGITEEQVKEPIDWDDQALFGIGTQMTAMAVENELTKLNLKFKRYDDADLNADIHHYDWKATNSLNKQNGQRRFWICST